MGIHRVDEKKTMNPFRTKHTQERVSPLVEGKEKNTMKKEKNRNITPFVHLNSRFNQNTTREVLSRRRSQGQKYGRPVKETALQ